MKSIKPTVFSMLAIAMLALPLRAEGESSRLSSAWRSQVNINYVSGMSDLIDAYETEGFQFDYEIPIGISFSFGKEFSNGIGWDSGIGPAILIIGDVNDVVIPIGAGLRYSFSPEKAVNPFIRAGAQYTYVSGDYLDSPDLGFNLAAGLEFSLSGKMSWGLEVKYDNTEIDFNGFRTHTHIKPYGLVLGGFFSF